MAPSGATIPPATHDDIPRIRALLARSSAKARQPYPTATGVGFSIGMPTMLPHSVHEPS